ncbi:MAG: S24 family peptidase [Phycisphaerae bacterium]
MSDSDISNRLSFLRKRAFGPRGKKSFSAALGIPLTTYASYESGRIPPPELLVKVSEITGCDLSWLLTGKLQTSTASSKDPEISEILSRMEKLIAAQPKAKQAVKSLMEVLATGLASNRPQSLFLDGTNQTIIPILGTAAAGLPAFWLDAKNEPIRSFCDMVNSWNPNDLAQFLPHQLVDPLPPYTPKGEVQIFQIVEPVDIHGLLIDGFLMTENLIPKGKLLAVRIDGDSMEPTILQGDIIIADTGQPAQSGQIALLEFAGGIGALCKLFFREKQAIRITSMNREYETQEFGHEKLNWAFAVVGVVRGKG